MKFFSPLPWAAPAVSWPPGLFGSGEGRAASRLPLSTLKVRGFLVFLSVIFSSQFVAKQEFQRAVQSDMWQGKRQTFCSGFKVRWAEPDKSQIGLRVVVGFVIE